MKQLKIWLSVVALMVAISASAQVKFGIKGGFDIAEMSFKNDVFNTDNRLGWFVGPTLKIGMPLTGLSVDLSALYNQREATVDAY